MCSREVPPWWLVVAADDMMVSTYPSFDLMFSNLARNTQAIAGLLKPACNMRRLDLRSPVKLNKSCCTAGARGPEANVLQRKLISCWLCSSALHKSLDLRPGIFLMCFGKPDRFRA